MEIRYNVTGARRKELVKIISGITGSRAEYQYMPTCNYKIGCFTVTSSFRLAPVTLYLISMCVPPSVLVVHSSLFTP